jgi:hypothetical protein
MVARVWFGLTALAVVVGMVIQLRATARLDEGFFDSDAKRVANVFCFFTIGRTSTPIPSWTSATSATRE